MGILIGLVCVTPLVLGYLVFIRWTSRLDPEPWLPMITAFLWGAVIATAGGGFATAGAEALVANVTSPLVLELLGAVVFAPIFEELAKALGVYAIAALKRQGRHAHDSLRGRAFGGPLDGPLEGALYGGVVGLGFTLTEDILYISGQYRASGLGGAFWLFFLRTVVLGFSHCTFTACTGLGLGIARDAHGPAAKLLAPMLGLFCAIAMHAMHNFLPHFGDAGAGLMVVISWVIDVLFFALLGGLVVRERGVLVRELVSEVGAALLAPELRQITRYFGALPRDPARRDKRRQLIELAFVKRRRRRDPNNGALATREGELRAMLDAARQRGVRIDAPPGSFSATTRG